MSRDDRVSRIRAGQQLASSDEPRCKAVLRAAHLGRVLLHVEPHIPRVRPHLRFRLGGALQDDASGDGPCEGGDDILAHPRRHPAAHELHRHGARSAAVGLHRHGRRHRRGDDHPAPRGGCRAAFPRDVCDQDDRPRELGGEGAARALQIRVHVHLHGALHPRVHERHGGYHGGADGARRAVRPGFHREEDPSDGAAVHPAAGVVGAQDEQRGDRRRGARVQPPHARERL